MDESSTPDTDRNDKPTSAATEPQQTLHTQYAGSDAQQVPANIEAAPFTAVDRQATDSTSQPGPAQRSRGKRVLASVVSLVVAVVVAFLVRQGFNAATTPSTTDQVKTTVAQIKKQYKLPRQVDSVTTLTGVEAEGATVHYEYTISSTVDPATTSEMSRPRRGHRHRVQYPGPEGGPR
ncbi:MAG: hypothetical protein ABI067_17950 [Leifsonia sp.]